MNRHPERIAERSFCALDRCASGRVVLSIGPVSLRLGRDELDELRRFLGVGMRNLVLREEHGADWRRILGEGAQ